MQGRYPETITENCLERIKDFVLRQKLHTGKEAAAKSQIKGKYFYINTRERDNFSKNE